MDTLAANCPELLGRIFEALNDEERCNTIPLVCRAWRDAHHDYPPHRKRLAYCDAICEAQVRWFLKVAPTVEELCLDPQRDDGLLPQLLAMAALRAPKLRSCRIGERDEREIDGAALSSIPFLTQLTMLGLHKIALYPEPPETSRTPVQRFSALRSLRDLSLTLSVHNADPPQAHYLWKALAALPALTTCHFIFDEAVDLAPLLDSLTMLTQIRSLSLWGPEDELMINALPGHFGAVLTQLTSLDLTLLPLSSLRRGLGLPNLHSLQLTVHRRALSRQALHFSWESSSLTRLEIRARGLIEPEEVHHLDAITPVENILSPALPASSLRRLRSLTLAGLRLDDFPHWLAERLRRLTELDLKDNCLQRVPTALSQLTDLQTLMLGCNAQLRLHPGDVDVLSALPSLRFLDLFLPEHQWTMRDMQVAWGLSRRLPQLECPFVRR